jgi:putative transposase
MARCEDWPWASTGALIAGDDDRFVTVSPALQRVDDFAAFLSEDFDEAFTYAAIRRAESTGRPISSPEWLAYMEEQTSRTLAPQKRGPKPRSAA